MKVDKSKWKKLQFTKCVTTVRTNPAVQKQDYLDSGAYPIISQEKDIISGYCNTIENLNSDLGELVIFGDHTRVLKYIDFPFCVGADGTKVLKPNPIIKAKYLFYYLIWLNVPNMGYARHFKYLKESFVTIPSLNEQAGIVAELDSIQGMIDGYKAQIADLDTLAQSIFLDTFGDPVFNPKGWPIKNLVDICHTISTGITYKPDNLADNGTIVLRSSNIQNSEFVLYDIVRIDMPLKPSQYVKKNDILMCSRNGSARLVGKVTLIPELNEDMSWGAFMTIIRSDFYHFLFQYFRLPAFREQLTKTKTTTVNQITIGMLKEIHLPVPPLELQEKYSERIEQIEALKTKLRAQVADCEMLMAERMQYYFS